MGEDVDSNGIANLFANGIYIIKISDSNNIVEIKRFIIIYNLKACKVEIFSTLQVHNIE